MIIRVSPHPWSARIVDPYQQDSYYLNSNGDWIHRWSWQDLPDIKTKREVIGHIYNRYHVIKWEYPYTDTKNYIHFTVGDRKPIPEEQTRLWKAFYPFRWFQRQLRKAEWKMYNES